MISFMRYGRWVFAILVAASLRAQLPPIGQPFALTNTRYGTVSGSPVLRTNGRDAFLFWTNGKLRVTRLAKSDTSLGRLVFDFDVTDRSYFDAVWTGTQFLVVSNDSNYQMWARLVDASGEPAGDAFRLATPDHGLWPRMAFNGKYVLLIVDNQSFVLTPDGQPAGFAPQTFVNSLVQDASLVATNGSRFAVFTQVTNEQTLSIFDENGQLLTQRRFSDLFTFRRTAIASDGRRFLIAQAIDNTINTTLVEPDGSFGSATQLEIATSTLFSAPIVTWNGSRWTFAYQAPVGSQTVIAESDADARFLTARRTIDSSQQLAMVAIGSRVVTSWVGVNGSIYTGEFPAVSGDPVSFGAMYQGLLASATSSSATLVVWLESGNPSIRAGIRTRDGRWRESTIAALAVRAAAASDGQGFMVVLDGVAIPLDAEGRVVPGVRTTIGFTPDSIAWNGRSYAVIGVKDGAPTIALLSPSGSVSTPVALPHTASSNVVIPRIASNGTDFFAVWAVPQECGPLAEPVCFPGGIAGTRLGADLHVLDPEPQTFVSGKNIYGADLAWTGSQYVVAWTTSSGIFVTQPGTETTTSFSSDNAFGVSVASVAGRAAIGWTLNRYPTPRVESRVALLGDSTSTIVYQGDDFPGLRLVTLAGGELALLSTLPQNSAPLYGTRHVMMAIGSFGLPPLPDAPSASLKQDGNTLILGWGRPPQRVNGYRVEYRVNNGAWTEVERWFDPEERTYTTSIPAGASLALRVRAWNDAGTGAYSQAVIANTNRTRSARH
jgi:hypothetical protein